MVEPRTVLQSKAPMREAPRADDADARVRISMPPLSFVGWWWWHRNDDNSGIFRSIDFGVNSTSGLLIANESANVCNKKKTHTSSMFS